MSTQNPTDAQKIRTHLISFLSDEEKGELLSWISNEIEDGEGPSDEGTDLGSFELDRELTRIFEERQRAVTEVKDVDPNTYPNPRLINAESGEDYLQNLLEEVIESRQPYGKATPDSLARGIMETFRRRGIL